LTSAASISCSAAGDCVVVGQSSSGSSIATLQNGTWQTQSVEQGTGVSS
jgi:hypothetical protein